LQTTADGGYVISGSTNGFGVSNNDLYIIKTDSNGNAGCNENNVLTNTNITFLTILPTATTTNAAYVISIMDTTMKITGSGGTASTLCFSSGINEVHINNETLSIYPNPATNQITIEFELTETKNIFFEIKNVLGQTITSISNTAFQKGINKIEIDVSDQPSGIYILQLLNNRKSVYAKFIKQ
ncbi:MAG: T9SS type A sorting domain-containing protein, partial [Methanobacterium sp.]